jgi:hypothetical protein
VAGYHVCSHAQGCCCECLLQIEVIRNQGPMVWKLYFEGILATAHRHFNSGLGNLPMWNWVECDVCKRWRLVLGGRGRMHTCNSAKVCNCVLARDEGN